MALQASSSSNHAGGVGLLLGLLKGEWPTVAIIMPVSIMDNHVEKGFKHSKCGFRYLPVELFKTERSKWVLDASKVEFFEIDDVAFDVFDCLRTKELSVDEIALRLPQHPREQIEQVFDELISAQRQGFFLPAYFQRTPRFKSEDYQSVLNDKMGGLTISLTTRCNLTCSYCIFGGGYSRYPAQSGRTMTWPVLRNAADFLLMHSKKSESIHVLFFGGEPLIAFKLIRQAVDYLQTALINDQRKLRISICTNGTILSEAILSFLVRNQVTLQVSLDGDRELHDRNRRFMTNTKGSFDTILRNLKTIEKYDHDYFREFVRIKGVIESVDGETQDTVFQEHPIKELLDRDYVSFLLIEPHYDVSLDTKYFGHLEEIGEKLVIIEGASTFDELLQDFSPSQKQFFWQSYGWFFAAQAVDRLEQRGEQRLPFSKGCMLGASEGHVGPDGNISICHKAQRGRAFVIGNVNDGRWDFARIQDLDQWLHGHDECSSCFAQRFCDLCFEKLKGEPEELGVSRTRYCEFMRCSLRKIFHCMLQVMDKNPNLWEEVVRYINRRVERERIKRGQLLA